MVDEYSSDGVFCCFCFCGGFSELRELDRHYQEEWFDGFRFRKGVKNVDWDEM